MSHFITGGRKFNELPLIVSYQFFRFHGVVELSAIQLRNVIHSFLLPCYSAQVEIVDTIQVCQILTISIFNKFCSVCFISEYCSWHMHIYKRRNATLDYPLRISVVQQFK
jgi:hypothetical protein